jgi:tRNA (cmo5U34)-methyltransferase
MSKTITGQIIEKRRRSCTSKKEWSGLQHAKAYLSIIDNIPHRSEGELILLEHIPINVKRILDLGTGNGRLLRIIKMNRPHIRAVAVDVSPIMLMGVRKRFPDDDSVKIIDHDLNDSLLEIGLGTFDAIVTSLTIHHLTHERKYSIYREIFSLLNHGGIFCNLEHVDSPTPALHKHFLDSIGEKIASFVREEYSDKLLSAETQLSWLRQIGFTDVDCYWKWLEMALLIGYKG